MTVEDEKFASALTVLCTFATELAQNAAHV
jgi:hypothetical protein